MRGSYLEFDKRYWSETGNHYLILPSGANLQIRTADGTVLWSPPIAESTLRRGGGMSWGLNGRLTYTISGGGQVWTATDRVLDPNMALVLQANGALQLISPTRGVLWSSDGVLVQPPRPAAVPDPAKDGFVENIAPGSQLDSTRLYWSPSGKHFLTWTRGGNLVVQAADGTLVWAAGIQESSYARTTAVEWQSNGALSIMMAGPARMWSAPPDARGKGGRLFLRDDGVLQIIAPDGAATWSADGNLRAAPVAAPAQTPVAQGAADSVAALRPGSDLTPGELLWSEDKSHFLTLNPDGNLVIARADGGYVWGFDTALPVGDYQRVARAVWEPGGKLVAYAADGSRIWTAPEGRSDPSARLVLGSSGVLEIVSPTRGPLWSSTGDLSRPAAGTNGGVTQNAAPDAATAGVSPAPNVTAETRPPAGSPVVDPTTAATIVSQPAPTGAIVAPKPPIPREAPLPAATAYALQATESRVLSGSVAGTGPANNCAKSIAPGDKDMIGRLTVVSELYQMGCYTDGQFNQRDFRVDQGALRADSGLMLDAYTVHPAAVKPSKFLGSHHAIYYKFVESRDQTVYRFDGVSLKKVAEIPAKKIVPGQFTKVGDLDASLLERPTTFVFAASDQAVSQLHKLAEGVEGALIADTPLGLWESYHYNLPAAPFDTVRDYIAGPNTHQNVYGQTRRFFGVDLSGQAGVV